MNSVMLDGQTSAAEGIVYGAFDLMQKRAGNDPIKLFPDALGNVKPHLELSTRRVRRATYQSPLEARSARAQALASRLLIHPARAWATITVSKRLYGTLPHFP